MNGWMIDGWVDGWWKERREGANMGKLVVGLKDGREGATL